MMYRLANLQKIELKSSPTAVAGFKDQKLMTPEASSAVGKLRAAGLIQGTPDGYFLPKARMTKGQAAVLVYRTFSLSE